MEAFRCCERGLLKGAVEAVSRTLEFFDNSLRGIVFVHIDGRLVSLDNRHRGRNRVIVVCSILEMCGSWRIFSSFYFYFYLFIFFFFGDGRARGEVLAFVSIRRT